MKLDARKMESCFVCCNASYFILPNKALFDYKDVKVECDINPTFDKLLVIGPGCPSFKPYYDFRVSLKES